MVNKNTILSEVIKKLMNIKTFTTLQNRYTTKLALRPPRTMQDNTAQTIKLEVTVKTEKLLFEKSLHRWCRTQESRHWTYGNRSAPKREIVLVRPYPIWPGSLGVHSGWAFSSQTTPVTVAHKSVGEKSHGCRHLTCSVLACLSLNLSSVYRSTSDVFPTQPSPNRTTLKLCEVVLPAETDGPSAESSSIVRGGDNDGVTFATVTANAQ